MIAKWSKRTTVGTLTVGHLRESSGAIWHLRWILSKAILVVIVVVVPVPVIFFPPTTSGISPGAVPVGRIGERALAGVKTSGAAGVVTHELLPLESFSEGVYYPEEGSEMKGALGQAEHRE